MIKENSEESLNDILQLLKSLLLSPSLPVLPEDLAEHKDIADIYNYLVIVRDILQKYAQGNFNINVPIKGFFAGNLKALQANLNHLSWQVQRVAEGDFAQRVDFMGDFSVAFNTMVEQMRDTLDELRRHEERMQRIANDLRKEIEVRAQVEEELKQSQERYQSLARLDPLTNLHNRRYFFELAAVELERLKRNSGYCCIGMLDVDHFKKFNDTYGHVRGDQCLKEVADKILVQTRKIDLTARYGGEEFIFLLPQTKIASGVLVANRIRTAISSTPIVIDDLKLNVTVSIGVSAIKSEDVQGDANELLLKAINEADLALYEAKRTGRNKVCSFFDLEGE